MFKYPLDSIFNYTTILLEDGIFNVLKEDVELFNRNIFKVLATSDLYATIIEEEGLEYLRRFRPSMY